MSREPYCKGLLKTQPRVEGLGHIFSRDMRLFKAKKQLSEVSCNKICEEDNSLSQWNFSARVSQRNIRSGVIASDWQSKLPEAITSFISKWNIEVKIKGLEREMAILQSRINKLESQQSIVIPVETFSPEPYIVAKPFNIVVQQSEGEYVASFFDANINASGETIEEAYSNFKDLIISTFEMLLEHRPSELGSIPSAQLVVLNSFIKREHA